ncbi:hypothetical protein A9267_21105 [Shewanella sp. UCD-FRSSP16_17]|uniref:hypothetical protein n=1 Tax=Shewanella sp. UCD-FRSSP16_17 TaxID=1853256 RepID=UPI0007EEE98B|nr:hypothetical protein [Shewanella sp. UCD-FRSSP16_17]OBT09336.1 hypothetical protein A9267_21105 [Shewanella sp. UCD-FRSSP16_17]
MVNLFLNSKTQSKCYLNVRSIAIIVVVFSVFLFIDVFLLDFFGNSDSFSKSYYIKFIITMLLLFLSKFEKCENNYITPAFHFSGAYWALWTGIYCLVSNDVELSKYIGILLVFGGFGGFCLIDELIDFLNVKYGSESCFRITLTMLLKVLLFSFFILAIIFFVKGNWEWPVNSFSSLHWPFI